MDVLDLLVLLVVAGICGSIGQAITGYSRGGCLGSIAIGFIGSLCCRPQRAYERPGKPKLLGVVDIVQFGGFDVRFCLESN